MMNFPPSSMPQFAPQPPAPFGQPPMPNMMCPPGGQMQSPMFPPAPQQGGMFPGMPQPGPAGLNFLA
jgi:hypothetical protein